MILLAIALAAPSPIAEDPAITVAQQKVVTDVTAWASCGMSAAAPWIQQPDDAAELARIALTRCSAKEATARTSVFDVMRLQHAATASEGVFAHTKQSVESVVAADILDKRVAAKPRR